MSVPIGQAEGARRAPGQAPVAAVDRARAWLLTGPLGRGLCFALDLGAAVRTALSARRAR